MQGTQPGPLAFTLTHTSSPSMNERAHTEKDRAAPIIPSNNPQTLMPVSHVFFFYIFLNLIFSKQKGVRRLEAQQGISWWGEVVGVSRFGFPNSVCSGSLSFVPCRSISVFCYSPSTWQYKEMSFCKRKRGGGGVGGGTPLSDLSLGVPPSWRELTMATHLLS